MTQVLAFVDPPTVGLRIGKASRRSFTRDELRERYADVIRWRDDIYVAFRFQSYRLGQSDGLAAVCAPGITGLQPRLWRM
jgi:hypothetical protein